MALFTPNYNLKMPQGADYINIEDINGNMSILDSAMISKLSTSGGTINGNIVASYVEGAVWNDYAEYRNGIAKPGQVVCETNSGEMKISTERLAAGPAVVSDTFGFSIGRTEKKSITNCSKWQGISLYL